MSDLQSSSKEKYEKLKNETLGPVKKKKIDVKIEEVKNRISKHKKPSVGKELTEIEKREKAYLDLDKSIYDYIIEKGESKLKWWTRFKYLVFFLVIAFLIILYVVFWYIANNFSTVEDSFTSLFCLV